MKVKEGEVDVCKSSRSGESAPENRLCGIRNSDLVGILNRDMSSLTCATLLSRAKDLSPSNALEDEKEIGTCMANSL